MGYIHKRWLDAVSIKRFNETVIKRVARGLQWRGKLKWGAEQEKYIALNLIELQNFSTNTKMLAMFSSAEG